jgi:polyhydroxybutyrate depolymerase
MKKPSRWAIGILAGSLIFTVALLLRLRRQANDTWQPPVPDKVQENTIARQVQVADIDRTYRLHIPPGTPASQARPLVIAFHGSGGDGMGMEQLTGLSDVADRKGFLVAYPDGLRKIWSSRWDPWYDAATDDTAFIKQMIADIQRDYAVDAKRIYATGISMGGFFSKGLACDLSGTIAAVAAVAANTPISLTQNCLATRPVPVLLMMGTTDPRLPYDGDKARVKAGEQATLLSATESLEFWRSRNQLQLPIKVLQYPDRDPADGTKVVQATYPGKYPVTLYTIEGGGHTWPGGLQYLSERTIGKTSQDIDASDVIWTFFAANPKQ